MSNIPQDANTDNAGQITRDPDDWTTGTEKMTTVQESQLKALAEQAKVDVPADLSGAGAHIKIDELKQNTGTPEE